MMSTLWIGIDPGGRETGIVSRVGHRVIRATLVTSETPPHVLPNAVYLEEILDAVADCRTGEPYRVAVEKVVPPNPHVNQAGGWRATNMEGLLGCAIVLGAVLARYPLAVQVAPARNGSGPLASYPAELVGERETAGTGKRRHLRSAWDVSLAGPSCAVAS